MNPVARQPLRDGWRFVELQEVGQIVTGSTPPKAKTEYYGGSFPFVKPPELCQGPVTDAKDKLSDKGVEVADVAPVGSVLVSCIGNLGKTGRATQPVAFNQQINAIVPHEPNASKWIFYAVQTPDFASQLANVASATTIAIVNKGKFSQLRIPLAPEDEQREIVAEIEKQFTRLEAGVAGLRRVQANLKRYRAAVLKAACEGKLVPTESDRWATTMLGTILTKIEAGKSFRCEERPPHVTEVGVVKVSAVTWGTFDERETKTCLDKSRVDERYFIRPGDFLFSRANTIELVGACVIASTVTLRLMLSDKILRFRFAEAVMPQWVLYWLRCEFGKREIQRLSTGNQESMRNIGQDRIRQISISVPPLAEQQRIIAEVERRLSLVEELEAVVNANLQRANRLRQAILQRAFEGNLHNDGSQVSETSTIGADDVRTDTDVG